MRRRIKKPRILKLRRYAACLIYLNEYLASFPGDKQADKVYVTGFNDIFYYIMPNSWPKKAYVQGFDCEYIYF